MMMTMLFRILYRVRWVATVSLPMVKSRRRVVLAYHSLFLISFARNNNICFFFVFVSCEIDQDHHVHQDHGLLLVRRLPFRNTSSFMLKFFSIFLFHRHTNTMVVTTTHGFARQFSITIGIVSRRHACLSCVLF